MAVCEYCKREFERPGHPRQRFCSVSCGVSARHKEAIPAPAIEKTCAQCGVSFTAGNRWDARKRKYCSLRCSGLSQKRTVVVEVAPVDESPLHWDGVTRYSDPPQYREYWLTCMWCGRHESLCLTDSDARALQQKRCEVCRGRMTLDPDYGSREPSMPTFRYTSDPRKWLTPGAA